LAGVDLVPTFHYDVSGDGLCTPYDVLLVINFLESVSKELPDGEGHPLDSGRPSAETAGTGTMLMIAPASMEQESEAWAEDIYAEDLMGDDEPRLTCELPRSAAMGPSDVFGAATANPPTDDSPWDDELLGDLEDTSLNLGDVLGVIAHDIAGVRPGEGQT
jgi:hypothetical protein